MLTLQCRRYRRTMRSIWLERYLARSFSGFSSHACTTRSKSLARASFSSGVSSKFLFSISLRNLSVSIRALLGFWRRGRRWNLERQRPKGLYKGIIKFNLHLLQCDNSAFCPAILYNRLIDLLFFLL